MSATPADDAQTSPAWNCGCKDTKKNRTEQIKKMKWQSFDRLFTLISVRRKRKWQRIVSKRCPHGMWEVMDKDGERYPHEMRG